MPSETRYESTDLALVTVVAFAEFVYRYAKKIGALLSRPVLWPAVLLLLPKINLIPFRNETAGIRFDDFILLIVTTLLLCGWIADLDFHIDPVPGMGFAVVAIFCTSNFINAGHSNFLYSLRLVEYLIFFWAGKYFVRGHYDFISFVELLLGVNCGVIFLQYVGIIGGFTADGYESEVERPFGLSANHPAEMGALLNLAFAALVFGHKNATRFWHWCVLTGFCIFLTGSRSALFAHSLLTLIYVYKHSKNRTLFAIRTAAIVGLLAGVFAVIPNSIGGRSTDLLSTQNFETFRDAYDAIPTDSHFTGFVNSGDPGEAPEGVDPSWYMRGFKWAQVVKTMFAQRWTVWIMGLGPGTPDPGTRWRMAPTD